MSDDRGSHDPRRVLREMLAQQQRLPPRPTEQPVSDPGQQDRTPPPGQPADAPRRPPELPPPAEAAAPNIGNLLAELERHLGEAAAQERRLAALEQQLARRLDELNTQQGAAVPNSAVPPVMPPPASAPEQSPQALKARQEELDRRLAEVAAREQRLAMLEQQVAERLRALAAVPAAAVSPPRQAEPPEAPARPAPPLRSVRPRDPVTAPAPSASPLPSGPTSAGTRVEPPSRRVAQPEEPNAPSAPRPTQVIAPALERAAGGDTTRLPPMEAPPAAVDQPWPLLWMALPLLALAVAAIVVVLLTHRGSNQPTTLAATSSQPALTAPAPTATPREAATATALPATATPAAAATPAAVATTAPTVASAAAVAPPTAATTAAGAGTSASSSSLTNTVTSPSGAGSTAANSTPLLSLVATMTVGQSLCDLAVDDAGQHLYVTDDGTEQLLVVDPATQQSVQRFNLSDSLCSIALDQQSQTVYAPTWHRSGTNKYDSSQIQAVNLASGVIRSIADTMFPTGPFFDSGRRLLFVGNTAEPTLLIFNTATGAAATTSLSAVANRIAVSPSNGNLYLASPDGGKLLILNVLSGKVVASLDVGQRPWGVAADPRSGRVLVSAELSGSVSLVDPSTNQVIRTTPTGSHPRNVAVDASRGRFYVLNSGDRTVSVLDSDGTLLGTSAALPGTEDTTGLAVAAQSGQVFVVTKTHIDVLR